MGKEGRLRSELATELVKIKGFAGRANWRGKGRVAGLEEGNT
jgi:hypothetical protein